MVKTHLKMYITTMGVYSYDMNYNCLSIGVLTYVKGKDSYCIIIYYIIIRELLYFE